MGRNVKIISDKNNMDRLIKVVKELDSYSVEIGIFAADDSFYAMLANVHEFGITIRPKNASALTIPVNPKAHGKSAGDFPNIFRPKGTDVLAIPKGKGEFEVLFLLLKSVTIPERSFIRSTFDEKNDDWMPFIERLINQVTSFNIEPRTMYERLGARIAGDIQEKMTVLRSPANKKLTIENKGSSNPLIDTGGLRARVTWKVVKKHA